MCDTIFCKISMTEATYFCLTSCESCVSEHVIYESVWVGSCGL